MRLRALCSLVLVVLGSRCAPLSPPSKVSPPTGLMCAQLVIPSGSLTDTLAAAVAGDCVVLPAGTYEGSFVVPGDVSLVGALDAGVTLTGGDPVLSVRGGTRSVIQGLHIAATGEVGIAIEPGPVRLIGVKVTQASKNGLTATCTRGDCETREVSLTDCELAQNGVGLRLKGARVRVEGGRIAEQTGTSLSSGSGIVASDGATLQVVNATIEGNQNIGVLVDGALTRATFEQTNVRNNLGRGLWAQGQVADAGEATVRITGGEFTGNALVGIGARELTGLVISDATISSTTTVRVPIDISRFEDVGDGVGLFAGASKVTLERVTMQNNARAQLLADAVGADVQVVNSTATGGRFRAVVQHASSSVQVDTALVDDAGVDLIILANPVGLLP